MRRYTLRDLTNSEGEHIFSRILSGRYLAFGGIGFKTPNQRSHTNDGPGGIDSHVHDDDEECFVILQGKAEIEIDGVRTPLVAGDIVVVEPGEDHHLVSDEADPCVNLYLHAADAHHLARNK